MMENTLVIIKPDAVRKKIVGEIIGRLEGVGFEIVEAGARVQDEYNLRQLYKEHEGKSFYARNLEFMLSGVAVVLWLRAANAIKLARGLIGNTDPREAALGTIRGDFGNDLPCNCIHASDSVESADRELCIFFDDYGL